MRRQTNFAKYMITQNCQISIVRPLAVMNRIQRQIGGYFAQVRVDSVALRNGFPVRPVLSWLGSRGAAGLEGPVRAGERDRHRD
jgi:hypothetical protein